MKRALSLFLLLSLCLSLFACGKNDDVDFVSDRLKPYINFSLSDITGGSYTLQDQYGTPDAADVERKFRFDRLTAAMGYENGLRTEGMPVFGDAAHLYYEIAFGEKRYSNLYTGEGTQTLVLGYYEFLDDLNARDEYPAIFYNEALTDYVSQMTVPPRVTEGVVKQGDKVRISYERYNDKDILVGKAQNLRIDTDSLELYEEIPTFLLESLVGKDLGAKYTVSGTETVTNEDGTTTTATFQYKVTPVCVVEERFDTVMITVPSDAYLPEDGEELVALNGKTVTFRIMLESFYQFDTPALNDAFLSKTYGFVTGEHKPDAILRVATQKYIEQTAVKREAALKSQALSTVMTKVRENGGVKLRPDTQYRQYYNEFLSGLGERYKEAMEYAEKQGESFTMSLEDYAIYYLTYYGLYDSAVYASLEEYIDEQAKIKLDARILLMGAAELAGLRLKKDEYRTLFEEELQKQIDEQNASSETAVTREELIEAGGGEAEMLLSFVLTHAEEALTDYIYENNTWTVKDVSES